MAKGMPVVMSSLAAAGFQISQESSIGCVGQDDESFKNCVISAHNNENHWTLMQRRGLAFIEKTHNPMELAKTWADIISFAIDKHEVNDKTVLAKEVITKI